MSWQAHASTHTNSSHMHIQKTSDLKDSQVWWCLPGIPALRRSRSLGSSLAPQHTRSHPVPHETLVSANTLKESTQQVAFHKCERLVAPMTRSRVERHQGQMLGGCKLGGVRNVLCLDEVWLTLGCALATTCQKSRVDSVYFIVCKLHPGEKWCQERRLTVLLDYLRGRKSKTPLEDVSKH